METLSLTKECQVTYRFEVQVKCPHSRVGGLFGRAEAVFGCVALFSGFLDGVVEFHPIELLLLGD